MARPLTKGECIGIRLPLDDDAQLRDIAERDGVSPGQFVAALVLNRLRGTREVALASFGARAAAGVNQEPPTDVLRPREPYRS